MSIRIAKLTLHGFRLVVQLLGICLEAIRKVLDIIDDGIKNGSANLPSWYFELVDILNVLQDSCDRIGEINKSDELKNVSE